MITITRWRDVRRFSMTEVEQVLCSEHSDETDDKYSNYIRWSIKKEFPENKKSFFNGNEVEYNYYTFSVVQVPKDSSIEDGVKKEGFLIVFLVNGNIKYIINKNSDAQHILRKLLKYTGKNEIVKEPRHISKDMFVWLICKVYQQNNLLKSESKDLKDLTLTSIRGFKGDTEDYSTKVSAEGESVTNIISTLSFLIESRNLNQISLDLSYGNNDNIELKMTSADGISVNEERYLGDLLQEYDPLEAKAHLVLLIYSEIIPLIKQTYNTECETAKWDMTTCINFLQEVAKDLSDKVSARIEELNKEPEQLQLQITE